VKQYHRTHLLTGGLLLLALLLLALTSCGDSYAQENSVIVAGSGNDVSIQIGQNSQMRQDNRYGGDQWSQAAADREYKAGAAMGAFGVFMIFTLVGAFGWWLLNLNNPDKYY
jgi:hypothetical protein